MSDNAVDFTATHSQHIKNDKSKTEKWLQRKAFPEDWKTDGTFSPMIF